MDKKIDLRILKTYKKLTDAMREIINETPIDDVTVFDLCERAGIRRATFYKHFRDKNDFLSTVIKAIIDDMTKTVSRSCDIASPVKYFSLFVKQVISYFNERPGMLENLISSSAFPVMLNMITSVIHTSLIEKLRDAESNGVVLVTDIEATATFINGGISSLLVNYFMQKNVTEDELVGQTTALLQKIFS